MPQNGHFFGGSVFSTCLLPSAIFLFDGEGALEASPQLLLLLYIIGSDAEREIHWIQKASIASSLLAISKTSIEMFVSESYYGVVYGGRNPSDQMYYSEPGKSSEILDVVKNTKQCIDI